MSEQSTGQSARYYKAVVLKAETSGYKDEYGYHREQNLTLRITSGPDSDKTVQVVNPLSSKPEDFDSVLSAGEWIIVGCEAENGMDKYYFSDFDRTPFFYGLIAVFSLSLVYFGRFIGLKSLAGIAIALILLWRGFIAFLLVPHINVYLLALLFCLIISFFVLIIVSGVSLKTCAALLGTWGGLVVAGILSYSSIYLMHLSGIDTEEAFMLKANILPSLDFHGVLFASMIISSLGAIIDVAISIASAQSEIFRSSPEISWGELYQRGINVGKDIMGAMSITLILAYVGSSLPLLLVIAVDRSIPFERVLNLPIILTELVRALVGSIGLIYALPVTALIMPTLLLRKFSFGGLTKKEH